MIGFLGELVFELIFEGIIEISRSSRVPKTIRYTTITIICSFYIFVIGLFAFIGIDLLRNNNILGGIVVSIFAILFFVMSVMAFRKVYMLKNT